MTARPITIIIFIIFTMISTVARTIIILTHIVINFTIVLTQIFL